MHNLSPGKHRFTQLDSLRGLAALAVFGGHSIAGIIGLPLLIKLLHTPLSIFINGNAAVMFFFVLSGFVLSLPFIDGQRPLNLLAFYTKRVFRIYPAFVMAIIVAIVLKEFVFLPHAKPTGGLWLNQYWLWDMNVANFKEILYTLLLVAPHIKFKLVDPPMWSLAVEMIMAFFIPFFILIASRCHIIINAGIFILLSYWSYTSHTYVTFHAGIFYLGVVLAKHRKPIISTIRRWSMTIKILLALVALILYNAGMQFLNLHASAYYVIFIYCLPAIGSAVIIALVLASSRLSDFFEQRPFVFMGTISYSFYLMHFPILLTLSSIMIAWSGSYLAVITGLFLTIAMSYIVMLFIERPFQAMASRLVKMHRFFNIITLKI
ncbi:acyltransferase [Mucilaginibacter panaciglaebae]|uniref:acyltransferase family protein n=1 Tax=Mucilaginibacter panaciglaebae TaxID=502331 RepID=UPI0031E6C3EB